jgi:hypothetical protein
LNNMSLCAGVLRPFASVEFSFAMMSFGTLAGACRPYHVSNS